MLRWPTTEGEASMEVKAFQDQQAFACTRQRGPWLSFAAAVTAAD
jgi:hypothetical protein